MAGQTITAVIAADARPFRKGMSDASKSTSTLTKGLKAIGSAATVGFAAAGLAAVAFGVESIKLADQSRQVSRGLEQAVKNSKAFGKSSTYIHAVTGALDEASTKLGELTGIDDEVISGLKRNWLAVPNIAKTGIKGINKLATVAADVAAGTGKDLETVANAFTKAYGDPKGAIAKLLRAGVVLSDQDKKRYQALIDQGKQTEALSFLTDTLGNKFKGLATASASPFSRLQVSFQNFQENVGKAFLPLIDKILPDLQEQLGKLAADPQFAAALKEISDTLIAALPGVIDFIKTSLPQAIQFLKDVADLFARIDQGSSKNTAAGKAASGAVSKALTPNFAAGYGNTGSSVNNIYITASSVSSSAETGRAIANALSNYYRHGGRQVK